VSDTSHLSVKGTIWQALKEFWLALLGASVWTGYHWWHAGVDKTQLIGYWCAAFFFISYITGHWNRIRHQGDTKAKLTAITGAMERFTAAQSATIETQTQMMAAVAELARQGSLSQPILADLSRMLVTANAQSTTANTAMMDFVQASISTVGSAGYGTGGGGYGVGGIAYGRGTPKSPFPVQTGSVTIAQPTYVPEDHVPKNQTVNSDSPTESRSGTKIEKN
jgi:hypothetical protein